MIPTETYNEINRLVPRLCVDVAVRHEGRILLLRRAIEPDKGTWALPGGGVLVGETLHQGAVRKAMQEIGCILDPERLKFLGIGEYFFHNRHDVAVTYLYDARERLVIVLDAQHDDSHWFTSCPSDINSALAQLIGGVFRYSGTQIG